LRRGIANESGVEAAVEVEAANPSQRSDSLIDGMEDLFAQGHDHIIASNLNRRSCW
jgi:hypothetical protein